MASKEYAKVRELFKPGLAVASDPTMLVREKMTATHPTAKPKDIIEELETIAGIPCAWVTTPDAGDSDRVVLLVHGGAFVSTKLPHYIPYCAGLSRHIPARFLVHEYSLAPEARFPKQIEETVAVYRALLERGVAPDRIAFAGDSCGGGIAVASLCRLRDAGTPLPACFIGLTPWFDLEQEGEAATKPLGVDPFVNRDWIRARGRDYVGPDGDVRNPLASPLRADLTGLPPMFLSVGDVDTTADDSTRMAQRAGRAGVSVVLDINAEMIHGFHGLAAMFPEGRASLRRAGAFLREQIPDAR